MEYKGIEITFYCSDCYREFKTLGHFNSYANLRHGKNWGCSPWLRADGRHRLETEFVGGRWVVRKMKRSKKINRGA